MPGPTSDACPQLSQMMLYPEIVDLLTYKTCKHWVLLYAWPCHCYNLQMNYKSICKMITNEYINICKGGSWVLPVCQKKVYNQCIIYDNQCTNFISTLTVIGSYMLPGCQLLCNYHKLAYTGTQQRYRTNVPWRQNPRFQIYVYFWWKRTTNKVIPQQYRVAESSPVHHKKTHVLRW